MTFNFLNILIGIFVLFSVSYILIGLYSTLYIKYLAKNKNEIKASKFLSIAIVSLAWVLATFVSILAASGSGILVFAVISLLFIFGFNYFVCEKLLGLTGAHKLIYSLTLSIIFNPAWLSLLGVL